MMHQQRPLKSIEHYSPEWVVKIAKACMGDIDLDPASSAGANTIIGAKNILTAEQNGLNYDWVGNVFVNPPGQPKKWFLKAMEERRKRNLRNLFFVVYSIDRLPSILKVCEDYEIYSFLTTIMIPYKRIPFLDSNTLLPQNQPLHGNAFIYISEHPHGKIHHEFEHLISTLRVC